MSEVPKANISHVEPFAGERLNFADHARKWSAWSKAFYNMKRAQGMKHHATVRALAYKWIRILFRIWKTTPPYNEATYLQQLKTNNSPLLQFLES